MFYMRLLDRMRLKIRELERQGVVEDAGAEPERHHPAADDAEAGANADVGGAGGDELIRRSKGNRGTEVEPAEEETEADYDVKMDTPETDTLEHSAVHDIADRVMRELGWARGHGSRLGIKQVGIRSS